MKKFLLALLTVACLACIGLAAASCKDAKYYTLYFITAEGAGIDCEIPSGYEVRSGYRVVFKVELDKDAYGEPQVSVNGEGLSADGNGFYSFKMKEDSTVNVTGVSVPGRYAVIFDKGDTTDKDNVVDYYVTYNAEYLDENGILQEIDAENKEGTALKAGTEVFFTVDASVYYGENPEFDVLSNSQIIQPAADGKYRIEINSRVVVSIQGLKLETNFTALEDGGTGTVSNPYKLRKPIDLFAFASFMSDGFYWDRFSTAYYSLENDIDMKGEELFIIGASDSRYFAGDFNGNGHKISNYYISAEAVDQDDYTTGFMSNIGLFGVAAGAQIYDLEIENFQCDADAAPHENEDDYYGFFIGGVVAYGVGVNITNCSVSGNILATAGAAKLGYVGGIIGYQMSALDTVNGTSYYSAVRSCSTNVTIAGRAGCVYGAGGIAGCVRSYGESISAMIMNSYSTGNVGGAMCAGGIAGIVYPYGSVTNCYSTGYTVANNRLGNDPDYAGFRNAYAGGIAGELGYDAVIANCFSAGSASAYAAAGSAFAKSGDIAGYAQKGGKDGGEYIQTESGLIHNCASVNDKSVTLDNDYIKNALGWSAGDFIFNENGYPTVNKDEGSNSFKITVNLKGGSVGGKSAIVLDVADEYYPMCYRYATATLDEYLVSDGGLRSFGYYFDEQLTLKVPASYVPAHSVALYAGFADLSEVAGRYYLQWTENGSGKYIELKPDGTLVYRDGALISEAYYYYDGATVTLCDAYLAIIDGLSQNYSSFKATVDGGVMTVWDNKYYPATRPVTALRELESFAYGKYGAAGTEYTFNADGTGVYVSGGSSRAFTYTVDGASLEIKMTGSTLTGTVSGGNVTVDGVSLTAYDKFEGVWELSADSHKQYTFDGRGGWTYIYYGYGKDGSAITFDSGSGSYTVSGDSINLGNGKVFTFKDGRLTPGGGVYYYKQYSFTGSWSNFARQFAVEIALGGITSDGFGEAHIDYGVTYGGYDLSYGVKYGDIKIGGTTYEDRPVIELYSNDLLIAELIYRENSRTLYGNVFDIVSRETVVMTFYMYDGFKGEWISDGYEVTFNGLGNYDVNGTSSTLALKGAVTVNGKAGTYTLENNTLSGTLSCDGKTYNISYDDAAGRINVTGAETFVLQPRDKWYKVELTDVNGNVYSFDGKGSLSGGGVMTVTDANGNRTAQSYNQNTVTISGNVFKIGSVTLYVNTKFTGEWYVAGSFGEKLVIGNFGADYTASGSYFGVNCVFTYYPDGNYATIADPAAPEASPLYINVLDGVNVYELAVGAANGTDNGLFSVCVKEPDGYAGEYSYDGGTLVLDGLGESVFTDGFAKYIKNGETVETYSYRVDGLNQILLRSDASGLYEIFYEDENGGYEKDGKHYGTIPPDNLYLVKARLPGGEISFCGNGKAVCGATVYEYEIKAHDAVHMEYTVTLTSGGDAKTYVLDYSSDVCTLSEIPQENL